MAKGPKEYSSPTTPGLQISFHDLIVEMVCLNMEPKLGPRFWSGRNKQYWGPKYAREISRGITRMVDFFGDIDLDTQLHRVALIKSVELSGVKTLLNEKSLNKLQRRFYVEKKKMGAMVAQNKGESKDTKIVDNKINSTFVDPPQRSRLGKIREIESGG